MFRVTLRLEAWEAAGCTWDTLQEIVSMIKTTNLAQRTAVSARIAHQIEAIT